MNANAAADAASRTATNATTKSFLVIFNSPRRVYRRDGAPSISVSSLNRSLPLALPKLHADRRASQPRRARARTSVHSKAEGFYSRPVRASHRPTVRHARASKEREKSARATTHGPPSFNSLRDAPGLTSQKLFRRNPRDRRD